MVLRFHMNSAKKMRPIPAMAAETMALAMSPLLVIILKSFDPTDRARSCWTLSKLALDERVGKVDGGCIKEGDRVDEVEVGRTINPGNTVLLITDV